MIWGFRNNIYFKTNPYHKYAAFDRRKIQLFYTALVKNDWVNNKHKPMHKATKIRNLAALVFYFYYIPERKKSITAAHSFQQFLWRRIKCFSYSSQGEHFQVHTCVKNLWVLKLITLVIQSTKLWFSLINNDGVLICCWHFKKVIIKQFQHGHINL